MRKIVFILLIAPCWLVGQDIPTIQDPGTLTVFISAGGMSGTGFYCSDSTTQTNYLVTACHVLIDTSGKKRSDYIITSSFRNNSLKDGIDSFSIDLKAAELNGKFKFNQSSDVAVIDLGKSKSGIIQYNHYVKKITSAPTVLNQLLLNEFIKISDLGVSSDIVTIGYPTSLLYYSVVDFRRPLVRSGIISGIDYSKRLIITDCPVYKGNSGGPVFLKRKFLEPGEISGLIGIAIQFIPLFEQWTSSVYQYSNTTIYNSGYSIVASADAILEEISKLKP